MAAVQILELNSVHEHIMQLILAKPQITLAELSGITGYTQSWISVVVRSHAFRERMQQINKETVNNITSDLRDRLITLADIGVSKLTMKVEKSDDPEFIRDTVDKVLGRLGYGVQSRVVVPAQLQQNNYFITKEELAQCRGEMVKRGEVVDATPVDVAPTTPRALPLHTTE